MAVRAALVLLLPARASTVCRVAIPAGGKKKGPISTAPRGGWSDLSGRESDASMDASPFFSASATTTEACVVAGSCARHKQHLEGVSSTRHTQKESIGRCPNSSRRKETRVDHQLVPL